MHRVITGPGGFRDFERHEMAVQFADRDVSIADWVLSCLANPGCEGATGVLAAIQRHRADAASTVTPCCESYSNDTTSARSTTERPGETWVLICGVGGFVCNHPSPGRPDGICGMPTESEPCPYHGTGEPE
jgi:hypothetical protein